MDTGLRKETEVAFLTGTRNLEIVRQIQPLLTGDGQGALFLGIVGSEK